MLLSGKVFFQQTEKFCLMWFNFFDLPPLISIVWIIIWSWKMYRARLYFKYEEQQQYRVLQPKQKYILSFNSLFLYIGLWVLLAGMLREILRDISRLYSHWSSSYITALLLAESFIMMLNQNPKPLTSGISCLLLVLYGIRELAGVASLWKYFTFMMLSTNESAVI